MLHVPQYSYQEQFSLAYVQAVCSSASLSVNTVDRDFGVDLNINGQRSAGWKFSPQIDIQVKSTSTATVGQNSVSFKLKRKNYDDLIDTNLSTPRYLFLVLIPSDPVNWLSISESEMISRKCGYWMSLKGMPTTTNESTVTINVPRDHLLTRQSVLKLMIAANKAQSPG